MMGLETEAGNGLLLMIMNILNSPQELGGSDLFLSLKPVVVMGPLLLTPLLGRKKKERLSFSAFLLVANLLSGGLQEAVG